MRESDSTVETRPRIPPSLFMVFVILLGIGPYATAANIVFAGNPMGPSSNIYSIGADGHLQKLTDDPRWRDVMAHIAPDGGIVFASDREENSKIDLYKESVSFDLFTLNNGSLTRLTNDASLEAYPQFSPDGTRIAFIKHLNHQNELRVMNRDGSNRRTITSAPEIVSFSWSPDGKSLAYAMRDGNRSAIELVKVESDSSSGRSLVDYRIQASDADSGSAKAGEIRGYSQVVTWVQWSPDGRKIAYVLSSTERQERVLKVLDMETGEDLQLSSADIQVQQPVTWAPNSEQLLYSALVDYEFHYDEKQHKKIYDGGLHIFLSDIRGQKSRQLTQGDNLHNRPVFSPDGKHIAYLYGDRLDSRTLALRIMTLDGKILREMYSGVTGSSFLYWFAPDNAKTAGLLNQE